MHNENNPETPTGQEHRRPLSNTALKTFVAICIKARKDEHVWTPSGGWAAYSYLPARSFRRSLTALGTAGLVSKEDGALHIDRQGWAWQEGRGTREEAPKYVRVPKDILGLPADLVRAFIACLSLSDWKTGVSSATETTVARRMGRSRPQASRLLDRLSERGLWRRESARTWRIVIQTARSEPFSMVPVIMLTRHFNFDFRTRLQFDIDMARKNSADTAEFVLAEVVELHPTEDENSADSAEKVPTAEVVYLDPVDDGNRVTNKRLSADRGGHSRTPPPVAHAHHAVTDAPLAVTGAHTSLPFFKIIDRKVGGISRPKHPTVLPTAPELAHRRLMAYLFSSKATDAEMYQRAVARQTGQHLPGMFGDVT